MSLILYNLKMSENKLMSQVAIPIDQYHEDIGPVIWWKHPINEEPYIGSPLHSDWTEDYYTHFTKLVVPHIFVC